MGDFVHHARARLAERSEELALAWLDAVAERLPEEPHRLFPTRTLLNRIPELLRSIAARLDHAFAEPEDAAPTRELRELVKLRRTQGYGAGELVAELELLGSIFFDALAEELRCYSGDAEPGDVLELSWRVHRSFARLARIASACYSDLRAEDRRDRASLLHDYARSLEHELRNRANNAGLQIQLAREALDGDDVVAARPRLEVAERAVRQLTVVGFDSLAAVALQRRGAPQDARRQRLDDLVRELVADLDDYARHYGVCIGVASELPDFPVDAGRVQLALAYLIGSAIRFRDPARPDASIRIRGARCGDFGRIELEHVGFGISPALQTAILGATDVVSATGESPGLGLLLAREALEQIGGRLRHLARDGRPRFVVEIPQPAPELVETRSDHGSPHGGSIAAGGEAQDRVER